MSKIISDEVKFTGCVVHTDAVDGTRFVYISHGWRVYMISLPYSALVQVYVDDVVELSGRFIADVRDRLFRKVRFLGDCALAFEGRGERDEQV